MGVQAYLTRLALGRSAYESVSDWQIDPGAAPQAVLPTRQSNQHNGHVDNLQSEPFSVSNDRYLQQYDNRGYPQNISSHALSRRSRRAQNDVLATVGVLHYPGDLVQDNPHVSSQSGPSSLQIQQDMAAEANLGTMLYNVHHALNVCSRSCLRSARHRLQTFRFYAGVPLHRIWTTEWDTFGPLLLLLGGVSGDLFIIESQYIFDNLARLGSEMYLVKILPQPSSFVFHRLQRFGSLTIKCCLQAFLWSIFAACRFPSILQGLGLWPLSPTELSWMDLVSSTVGSLVRPIPLPTSFTLGSGFKYLASVTTSPVVLLYLFDIVQHGTRPKVFSYIILMLPIPENLPHELSTVERIRWHLHYDRTNLSNYFKALTIWCGSPMVLTQPAGSTASVTGNSNLSNEVVVTGSSSMSASSEPEDDDTESNDAGAALSDNVLDLLGSNRAADSESRASRPASNAWQADVDGSHLRLTLPRAHCKRKDPPKQEHRVTQLTVLMANTVAQSIANIVTDILMMPLEALLVRSIALTYLNTPRGAAWSAMGFRNDIYPLGSWLGMGLRGGNGMDYVKKMVLCLGVDMVLSFAAWQTTAGAAWWFGKKKFKWGTPWKV